MEEIEADSAIIVTEILKIFVFDLINSVLKIERIFPEPMVYYRDEFADCLWVDTATINLLLVTFGVDQITIVFNTKTHSSQYQLPQSEVKVVHTIVGILLKKLYREGSDSLDDYQKFVSSPICRVLQEKYSLLAFGFGESQFISSLLKKRKNAQHQVYSLSAHCAAALESIPRFYSLNFCEMCCQLGATRFLTHPMKEAFTRVSASHFSLGQWIVNRLFTWECSVRSGAFPDKEVANPAEIMLRSSARLVQSYHADNGLYLYAQDQWNDNMVISEDKFKLPSNVNLNELWYHGTSRESAARIVSTNLDRVTTGTQDFGMRPSFYIGNSLFLAIDRAWLVSNQGSVLVFHLPADFAAGFNLWDTTANDWNQLVSHSRREIGTNLTDRADGNDGGECDFVRGQVLQNSQFICLRSVCPHCVDSVACAFCDLQGQCTACCCHGVYDCNHCQNTVRQPLLPFAGVTQIAAKSDAAVRYLQRQLLGIIHVNNSTR